MVAGKESVESIGASGSDISTELVAAVPGLVGTLTRRNISAAAAGWAAAEPGVGC